MGFLLLLPCHSMMAGCYRPQLAAAGCYPPTASCSRPDLAASQPVLAAAGHSWPMLAAAHLLWREGTVRCSWVSR